MLLHKQGEGVVIEKMRQNHHKYQHFPQKCWEKAQGS